MEGGSGKRLLGARAVRAKVTTFMWIHFEACESILLGQIVIVFGFLSKLPGMLLVEQMTLICSKALVWEVLEFFGGWL